MRLTLRTLLAWLDDTLPPGEVRQIGQQVAETPLAQELVDRIHRVTRQRRLTVPPSTGPDGTDPATVASYIDDGLEPDEIVEFEKKCLTSDVHLAEVASVHQILSLLAQKAKVPPEARERMYHLIKGREAVGSAVPRTFKTPKPVKEPTPVASWSPEPPPKASLLERYGLVGGIAATCLVLLWSAYMSLGPTKPPAAEVASDNKKKVEQDKPAAPAVKQEEASPLDMPDADSKKADAGKAPAKSDAEARPPVGVVDLVPLPEGASGKVSDKLDAVLLRFNPESSGKWERLAAGATLKDGDRIVNLPPFLAPLQIGTTTVTMVGDGELVVLAKVPGTSGRFELKRGRLRVAGSSLDPIAIPFDAGVLKLTPSPGAILGLERINHRPPGDKVPSAPSLQVSVVEGEATTEAGTAKETVSAGSTILFQAPDKFSSKGASPVPAWVGELALNDAQVERGHRFAAYFKPDRQAKACIVEAASDENPGVREDAIRSYAAIGMTELLVDTMSTANDPAGRKAAIAALREVARQDADSAKALRAMLEQVGGSKTWADTVESLLVGYSPREANSEATAAKLAELLKHEDVGIRELAADAILSITGKKDRLGYDPDKINEGSGLRNLQELILTHKARNVPAAPK